MQSDLNITWADELKARFNKHLEPHEVKVWESIISQEITDLKEGELLAAVRSLGERKRKGEIKYSPDVEQLKTAIIYNKMIARQQREGFVQGPHCAFCQDSGWLSYPVSINHASDERSLGTLKHRTEPGWGQYHQSTPCLCSAGERSIHGKPDQTRTEEEQEALRTWSRQVMAWLKTCRFNDYYEDRAYAI